MAKPRGATSVLEAFVNISGLMAPLAKNKKPTVQRIRGLASSVSGSRSLLQRIQNPLEVVVRSKPITIWPLSFAFTLISIFTASRCRRSSSIPFDVGGLLDRLAAAEPLARRPAIASELVLLHERLQAWTE